MPRAADGTMTLTGIFAVPATIPSSLTINSYIEDLVDETTDSVSRSGKGQWLANQNAGAKKLYNLANGAAATDAVTYGQMTTAITSANSGSQSGIASAATTVGGTADAITATFTPPFTAWTANMRFRFTSTGTNSITNPTINVDGLGAKTIKKLSGVALVVADIFGAGYICDCVYNGTDVILLNPASSIPLFKGAAVASAATVTLVPGSYQHITGTTTITDVDFAPANDGGFAVVVFDGVLTLTHNATTLVLPGAGNIITDVGDSAGFIQDAGDNARCIWYTRASGSPVKGTIQIVNFQTGAVATGTTAIPNDDTIPQITEGTEFMTLAITPKSATSKLRIDVVFNFAHTASNPNAAALFQDATANALAVATTEVANANGMGHITFTHYMTSGTTSATTFRVRAGALGAAGTMTFNGSASNRKFGGVFASSITITEYAV